MVPNRTATATLFRGVGRAAHPRSTTERHHRHIACLLSHRFSRGHCLRCLRSRSTLRGSLRRSRLLSRLLSSLLCCSLFLRLCSILLSSLHSLSLRILIGFGLACGNTSDCSVVGSVAGTS